MTLLRRLKIAPYVIFVVVLLLITAVFCVSFAAWTSSDDVIVDVDGGVGLFYVQTSNSDVVVRQTKGSCNADNLYTYKNYVCVYKKTDYVDMAFVNFSLELKSGSEDTAVKEFTVTRALADENGNPTSDKTDLSVFNFAAGDQKSISEFSESQYNSNPYVMLDFESGAGQYFALDVTIVTSAEVSFDFKAVATLYDRHECKDPDTLFFEFNNKWTRSYTTKMTVTKDIKTDEYENGYAKEDIDCQIDVILTAGTIFKMIRSNSDGTALGIRYRPQSGPNSVHSDYAEFQEGGFVRVTTSGLYRVRFYCRGTTYAFYDPNINEYRISDIDILMIRRIDDELTETSDPGVYVIGIFNDDKTCEEYRLVDDYDNVEGFLAVDYSRFKSIRVGDSYRVIELDGNGVKTELSRATVAVGSGGEKKLLYDTFTQTAYSTYNSYRFVVDLDGVVPNSNMSIGYRRIISDLHTNGYPQGNDLASAETAVLGFQFDTALQSFTDGGKTLYYADIPYDEQLGGKYGNGYYIYSGTAGDIVSVTVLGEGANSYNINKFSCDFTQLTGGYSYRITATAVPTAAQSGLNTWYCSNWIGNIRQGISGNAQDFALENAGYLVLDENGDTLSDLVRTESGDAPFTGVIKKTQAGNQKFVVLVNGNASLRTSYTVNVNSRITNIPSMPFAFGTIGGEKAIGSYFLSAGAGVTYISYLSQPVSVEVVSGAAWDDSWQEGYYAVGEFSRWKAYPEYMLTRSDTVKTDLVISHDRIITVDDAENVSEIPRADLYKIVYAYNDNGTATFVWYGKVNSYDSDEAYIYNGGGNISALDTTLTFNLKSSYGSEITSADGNYYAIGEFSDWKAYERLKLMPDESGYLAATPQYFYAGDQFKIFRNGVYYGIDHTTDNPDGNVTAAEGKIYFDAVRLISENKTDWTILDESYFNIGVTGGCIAGDRIRLFLTFVGIHDSPHLWAWGETESGTAVDYATESFVNARKDTKVLLTEIAPKIWVIDVERGHHGLDKLTGAMFVDSTYHNICSDYVITATWGGCQVFNFTW